MNYHLKNTFSILLLICMYNSIVFQTTYAKKYNPSLKKRKRKHNNIINLNTISTTQIEEALKKNSIDLDTFELQSIYDRGINILSQYDTGKQNEDKLNHLFGAKETNTDILVGNYWYTYPKNIDKKIISELVHKLDDWLVITLFATITTLFQLDLTAVLNNDTVAKKVNSTYEENKTISKQTIKKSKLYTIMHKNNDMKNALNHLLLLALKTILVGQKEDDIWRKIRTIISNSNFVKKFQNTVHQNKLLQKNNFLKKIKINETYNHIDPLTHYCIAAMACQIVDQPNEIIIDSNFFNSMILAITIPVDNTEKKSKSNTINHETHITMRDNFQRLCHLYNIKKISNLTESTDEALISTNKTIWNTVKKNAKWLGIGAAVALGVGYGATKLAEYTLLKPNSYDFNSDIQMNEISKKLEIAINILEDHQNYILKTRSSYQGKDTINPEQENEIEKAMRILEELNKIKDLKYSIENMQYLVDLYKKPNWNENVEKTTPEKWQIREGIDPFSGAEIGNIPEWSAAGIIPVFGAGILTAMGLRSPTSRKYAIKKVQQYLPLPEKQLFLPLLPKDSVKLLPPSRLEEKQIKAHDIYQKNLKNMVRQKKLNFNIKKVK
jgi:hypothetical protein